MAPSPVAPPGDLDGILPGADFTDAFALETGESNLPALAAARRALEHVPGWIKGLLKVRDRIVSPLGLETVDKIERAASERCGFFPIISQSPNRVVLGLDDRHLDFRIVVDTRAAGPGTRVTVTTLVKRHNALGRAYLATIMPFHKLIVPTLLARVAT